MGHQCPPPKKNHTGNTVNRQQRSKLKQSCHYLSYSAPPGVSWPLGNFLLNYNACRHLWSIMTVSLGSVLLRHKGRLISIKLKCYMLDVTSIRLSQPFEMYQTEKQSDWFLKCQRTYKTNWKPLLFHPAQWSKTFYLLSDFFFSWLKDHIFYSIIQ